MSLPNDRKVCCFGVVETSYVDNTPAPARRTRRGSVMVERSSVPRTVMVNVPAPPPMTNIYLPPTNYTYNTTIVPCAPAPTQQEVQIDATAAAIAELLASSPEEIRRQVSIESGECQDPSRQREREVRAEVERRMENERRIDEEARRVVKERNSAADKRSAELRQLEYHAQRRIEEGFRNSSSSLSSGREFTSRERLVIVERESDSTRHRCGNCHEFGHRSRDCRADVLVRFEGPRERRKSVSYVPRNHVKYVRGP